MQQYCTAHVTHLTEGIQSVHQLQLSISTQCDHLVHLLQLQAAGTKQRNRLFAVAIIPSNPQLAAGYISAGTLVRTAGVAGY
jgi:hypothetical protein